MDYGGDGVDHGGETLVGFVAAQGDAFELFDLAEEVLDQMAPFVDFRVDVERAFASGTLGDDDFGAAFVQVCDNPIRIKCFVGNEAAELDILDQRRDADCVVALPRQQDEADQIAEGVRERQNLARQAALGLAYGLAYGLALSPPFAPCPWRWTLTMVASTMAHSMSGSSETASKIRLKTSAFTQSRNRLNAVFHLPKWDGRSRQGLPVRAIHNTASRNNRPSLPVRPGSLALPRQCGSIFAHWASVKHKRSMPNSFWSLNHDHSVL